MPDMIGKVFKENVYVDEVSNSVEQELWAIEQLDLDSSAWTVDRPDCWTCETIEPGSVMKQVVGRRAVGSAHPVRPVQEWTVGLDSSHEVTCNTKGGVKPGDTDPTSPLDTLERDMLMDKNGARPR